MSKRQGEYITCPECRERISLELAQELGNIEKILNTTIVYCECGAEIAIMDKK